MGPECRAVPLLYVPPQGDDAPPHQGTVYRFRSFQLIVVSFFRDDLWLAMCAGGSFLHVQREYEHLQPSALRELFQSALGLFLRQCRHCIRELTCQPNGITPGRLRGRNLSFQIRREHNNRHSECSKMYRLSSSAVLPLFRRGWSYEASADAMGNQKWYYTEITLMSLRPGLCVPINELVVSDLFEESVRSIPPWCSASLLTRWRVDITTTGGRVRQLFLL